MTELDLSTTSIAPISDLTDVLLIGQYAETETVADKVAVRWYAAGVRRVVSTPGQQTVVQVSYRYLSRSDYLSLLDLVGVSVLFRDQRGRAVWGVIAAVTGAEFSPRDLVQNVTFSLENLTYSEIV